MDRLPLAAIASLLLAAVPCIASGPATNDIVDGKVREIGYYLHLNTDIREFLAGVPSIQKAQESHFKRAGVRIHDASTSHGLASVKALPGTPALLFVVDVKRKTINGQRVLAYWASVELFEAATVKRTGATRMVGTGLFDVHDVVLDGPDAMSEFGSACGLLAKWSAEDCAN